MSDEDYPHKALSALERTDVDALDQEVRDSHDRAVAAVDKLTMALDDDEAGEAVAVDAPEELADDEDEWGEKVDEAYEAAAIPCSRGTLTTKTIDEREYYYLQWRDGEKIKSRYVASVSP